MGGGPALQGREEWVASEHSPCRIQNAEMHSDE